MSATVLSAFYDMDLLYKVKLGRVTGGRGRARCINAAKLFDCINLLRRHVVETLCQFAASRALLTCVFLSRTAR